MNVPERAHVIDTEGIAKYRLDLARVLSSPEFQASPQCRRFLEYVSERAFSGGLPVDQVDLARDVLGRGSDFDPSIDASVRKLAMQVRQRLEQYNSGTGSLDRVCITLPLRSYVPQFQTRELAAPIAPIVEPIELHTEPDVPRPRFLRKILLAVAVIAIAAVLWFLRAPAAQPDSHIRILTQRGDITSPKPDPAPGTLRLFGEVGAAEDVIVQLTFRPDRERQHAGLVIWEGPRRFVVLERRFTYHNDVAFGYEYESYLDGHPITEVNDPDAQSGAPLWLRISRHDNTYKAFTSIDARTWTQVGESLTLPKPLAHSRVGIFAVNGRRDSPSIPADFAFPGVGLILPHTSDGDPWKFQSDCGHGPELFLGETLAVPPDHCSATWLRPAPAGDWTMNTRLDMLANPSLVAGLIVQTEQGRVRLLRYPSDGPKISLVHDGATLESVPDYPGSPPVYLRLRRNRDRIEGAVSVDARNYRTVGNGVSLSGLGKVTMIGAVATRRSGRPETPVPPLKLLFVTLAE